MEETAEIPYEVDLSIQALQFFAAYDDGRHRVLETNAVYFDTASETYWIELLKYPIRVEIQDRATANMQSWGMHELMGSQLWGAQEGFEYYTIKEQDLSFVEVAKGAYDTATEKCHEVFKRRELPTILEIAAHAANLETTALKLIAIHKDSAGQALWLQFKDTQTGLSRHYILPYEPTAEEVQISELDPLEPEDYEVGILDAAQLEKPKPLGKKKEA